MTAWWQDWRAAIALCCVCWGFWGVLGKMAAMRLGWPAATVLAAAGGLLVIIPLALVSLRSADLTFPGVLLGLGYGVAGALGGLFFTKALAAGPASAVAPLAEGYLIITVLLAVAPAGRTDEPAPPDGHRPYAGRRGVAQLRWKVSR